MQDTFSQISFFQKKFFFQYFFQKHFFLHLMNHKLMSKIRFHMHKTMKFYDLLPFFSVIQVFIQKSIFFKKNFFWKKIRKFFFENFLFAITINAFWNSYRAILTLTMFQKSSITFANKKNSKKFFWKKLQKKIFFEKNWFVKNYLA